MSDRRFRPINSGTFLGAANLTLKGGSDDHVYIQFFADAADQGTRSGYMGFSSAGSETFQFVLDGYSGGSFSFNKAVTIDPDSTGPFLTLGDGAGNTGDEYLRFNGDRAWGFFQKNDDASTDLELRSASSGKALVITDAGNSNKEQFAFRLSTGGSYFRLYDTGQTDYIQFAHDGTDANITTANTAQVTVDNNVNLAGHIAIVDGETAPTQISGRAIIYVDSSDGDLKVKFGDGHVAVLAADS